MNLSKVQILLAWILSAFAGKSLCICVCVCVGLDILAFLVMFLDVL